MAISKKGTRKIHVEGRDYRWKANISSGFYNVIIATENGEKITAFIDLELKNTKSKIKVTPFIIRQVILLAMDKNKLSDKQSLIKIGNVTELIDLDISGERKLKSLLKSIEENESTFTDNINFVVQQSKHFLKYGEWIVAYEILVDNLYEEDYELTEQQERLVKEIKEKYDQ